MKISSLSTALDIDALLQRWLNVTNEFAAEGEVALEIFQHIVDCYSEPHRAYHTLLHLQCLFGDLDTVTAAIDEDDRAALSFAVWFHDAIYRPGRADNEELSAQLASHCLQRLGADSVTIEHTATMIVATKHHAADTEDSVLQLFLDADMAILGYPRAYYENYVQQVREEFQHIPAPLFQQGRKQFLNTTLALPRIYGSEPFFAKFERQARDNLSWELTQLE